MAKYLNMLHQHGKVAQVPYQEFIELLEFKVNALKDAREKDNSWNYGIEDLEQEIERIKDFKSLLDSYFSTHKN